MFKKRKAKSKMLFMMLGILMISCLTGMCVAYLTAQSGETINSFRLGNVSCKIEEHFDENIKENVYIKNTSEAAVFVRSAIVVTWMSKDGNSVYAEKPVLNSDYILVINDEDWIMDSNGYYYYKNTVNAGNNTSVLIEEARLKEGVSPPEGFYLSVEIVSSAVQAIPDRVVNEVWKTVKYNGINLELVS